MTVTDAEAGLLLIEVFHALAKPGFEPAFALRLRAPKYNPGNRRRFLVTAWQAVTATVARLAMTPRRIDFRRSKVRWKMTLAAC